jgi:4-hydroxybenzoate polyprenyltransferase
MLSDIKTRLLLALVVSAVVLVGATMLGVTKLLLFVALIPMTWAQNPKVYPLRLFEQLLLALSFGLAWTYHGTSEEVFGGAVAVAAVVTVGAIEFNVRMAEKRQQQPQ